jgi:hypothetical protein
MHEIKHCLILNLEKATKATIFLESSNKKMQKIATRWRP